MLNRVCRCLIGLVLRRFTTRWYRSIAAGKSKVATPSAMIYTGKLRHPSDLAAINALKNRERAESKGIAIFDPKGIIEKNELEIGSNDRVFVSKDELKKWVVNNPDVVVLVENRVAPVTVLFYGLIAISAMVLPGLSGSFLLLFLGVYHSVFGAIHQCKDHVLSMIGRTPSPIAALTQGIRSRLRLSRCFWYRRAAGSIHFRGLWRTCLSVHTTRQWPY